MAKVKRGKALVAQLRAQAGVRDPEALAAYLGRFKKARKAGKSVAQAKAAAHGNGSSSGGGSRGTSKPKRITRDEVNRAPWKFSAQQYQSAHGIDQPSIGEISPTQHSRLGSQQRRRYESQRDREWQASADKKREWRDKVQKAYDEGKIDRNTSGLSREAKEAMAARELAKKKASQAATQQKADDAKRYGSIEDVKVGDSVYSNLYGEARVVKKSAKSLRIQPIRNGKPSVNRDGSPSTIKVSADDIKRGFVRKKK